jgi:predicted ATPase
VTLTGPGGIGKTRLALAAGERLRDRFDAGTVFVPMAGVTQPEQVLTGIARAVGVDLAGTGSSLEALIEGNAVRTAVSGSLLARRRSILQQPPLASRSRQPTPHATGQW